MEFKSVNSLLNPSILFSVKVSIFGLFIDYMRGLCLFIERDTTNFLDF